MLLHNTTEEDATKVELLFVCLLFLYKKQLENRFVFLSMSKWVF